jgi:hypothetical protein
MVGPQHPIGDLPSPGRIPLLERRLGIVHGIGPSWPRPPQGGGLLAAGRLDQQRGVILEQRPQMQVPQGKPCA